MPDRVIKFTAPAAGDHEVAIPEEFLHKDDILKSGYVTTDYFEKEVKDRLGRATKGLAKPEDLIKDDTFIQKVVETRKDDLQKLLGLPADKVDVPRIQGEAMDKVRREELVPLKTEYDVIASEVGELRHRDIDAQTAIASVELGVDPELQELVNMFVRNNFAWDLERKQWFQKKANGEDGFEFSGDPKNGQPYVKVKEFLEKIKQGGKKKTWFTNTTQAGPGYKGSHGTAGEVTAEKYQKLSDTEKTAFAQENPERFRQILAEIRTAGENKLLNKEFPTMNVVTK